MARMRIANRRPDPISNHLEKETVPSGDSRREDPLRHYPDGSGVADLAVRFHCHHTGAGREIIGKPKTDLSKIQVWYQAHAFSGHVEALAAIVDQMNHHSRCCFTLI